MWGREVSMAGERKEAFLHWSHGMKEAHYVNGCR